ncbi:TetR/AcrR family transcriptional regulator [Streptomyces sp. NPDC002851]
MTPKPAGRSHYHHGSLPAALTEAALEVLDERGPEQVSVREVARRAGVSPGAPFRHFADREALMTAVAGRVLADFEGWQRAAVAHANPDRPALHAFGLGFVRYALRYPHRFALVRTRVFHDHPPAELAPYVAGIDQALTDVVIAGQEAGELREGDPVALGLAGKAMAYGLAQMIVDGYLPPDEAERLAEQSLDALGIGLVSEAYLRGE